MNRFDLVRQEMQKARVQKDKDSGKIKHLRMKALYEAANIADAEQDGRRKQNRRKP